MVNKKKYNLNKSKNNISKNNLKNNKNYKKTMSHTEAGKLGGLAPHICRGAECVKLKKEGKLKSYDKKSSKKTNTKNNSQKKSLNHKQNAIMRLLKEIF